MSVVIGYRYVPGDFVRQGVRLDKPYADSGISRRLWHILYPALHEAMPRHHGPRGHEWRDAVPMPVPADMLAAARKANQAYRRATRAARHRTKRIAQRLKRRPMSDVYGRRRDHGEACLYCAVDYDTCPVGHGDIPF